MYKKDNYHHREIINRLASGDNLTREEWMILLDSLDDDEREYLHYKAAETARLHYGSGVYVRALIEISSYCKNNCNYCGIRCGNKEAQRYRLSKEEILECCSDGAALSFNTFVMQGGEVGRDIHVYRDLIDQPCEASIDAEAKYLLEFERSMLKKYNML